MDVERDLVNDPVTEWQVRWSDEGDEFGLWVADSPGSDAGMLTVRHADEAAGTLDRLVGPVASRRSFTLGSDRIAWVAPTERGTLELRLATWGAGGPGSVRLRDLDSVHGLPAF